MGKGKKEQPATNTYSNSQEWLQKMVHVALFLPVGPASYMFIHKTLCDVDVAELGGIWSAREGLSEPLFREDILNDLACRKFRVSLEYGSKLWIIDSFGQI